MNKQFNSWVITGIVTSFLVLFVMISGYSYFSDLKSQLAKSEEKSSQLQTQLTAKNEEITTKNSTITNLESQKTDLEGQKSGLTTDLKKKEEELTQRLGEVKKLQGSVKTVGRCLVGTVGLIEAVRQEDATMLRNSAQVMETTCKDAGTIIKQVEGFSTDSQTVRY